MKYLVTGGGGFIGSHLAAKLAASGKDDVVVFDNFSTGNRSNLQNVDATVIEGDLRDPAALAKAVQGVDTVFHHAALCSVARSMEDPVTTHDVNTTGTLNLLGLPQERRAPLRLRIVVVGIWRFRSDAEARAHADRAALALRHFETRR